MELVDVLLELIFTFVFSCQRLDACSLVCRNWRRVLESTRFWKQLSRKQFQYGQRGLEFTHILITLYCGECSLPLIIKDIDSKRIISQTNNWMDISTRKPYFWPEWMTLLSSDSADEIDVSMHFLDINENLYLLFDSQVAYERVKRTSSYLQYETGGQFCRRDCTFHLTIYQDPYNIGMSFTFDDSLIGKRDQFEHEYAGMNLLNIISHPRYRRHHPRPRGRRPHHSSTLYLC